MATIRTNGGPHRRRPRRRGRPLPPEWIVADPAQAADRILALTGDEEPWRAAGADASAAVVERWDWQVVRAQWDALLLPGSQTD